MSSSALEILAIARSSETFRWMIESSPALLALLIEASEVAAKSDSDRARLIETVACVAHANDKRVDARCIGDAVELEKWERVAQTASEDLGRLLKQLCPGATSIEVVSSEPAN
jgi:hypothetical protein